MKTKIMECRYCKEKTEHMVKRVCYKPHSSGSRSGGVKYSLEHCKRCNKRWYNGKLSKPMEQRKERTHNKIVSIK